MEKEFFLQHITNQVTMHSRVSHWIQWCQSCTGLCGLWAKPPSGSGFKFYDYLAQDNSEEMAYSVTLYLYYWSDWIFQADFRYI